MTTKLTLIQQAYLSDSNQYTASAVDEAGDVYSVSWDIIDGYDPSAGDESNACDWEAIAEVSKDGTVLDANNYTL